MVLTTFHYVSLLPFAAPTKSSMPFNVYVVRRLCSDRIVDHMTRYVHCEEDSHPYIYVTSFTFGGTNVAPTS
jgi:hypothetical protein